MGAQQKVLSVVFLKQNGAAASAQVEHEGHAVVGVVDHVAVAVAAAHQNGVQLIVGDEHVLGQFHGGYTGAAAVLHVDAPGVFGADAVLHVAGGGGQRIFLPLLGDAEDGVDLQGIDPGVFQTVQRGQRAHLLGAVTGVGRGDELFHDAQLVDHRIFRPVAAGSGGDLGGGHLLLGKIQAQAHDAYIWFLHIGDPSFGCMCLLGVTASEKHFRL